MVKRKFGRVFEEDRRDRKFALQLQQSNKKSRTWTCGKVLDQGRTPHCVGYAWAGWLMSSPIRQNPIHPDGIYTIAKLYDEWCGESYEGTSVRGGAKVLAITGHISEYNWAWDINVAVNHILEYGPLVLGTNWYTNMGLPDESGIIKVKGRLSGGHAILVYAANKTKGFVSLRNSWGSEWGVNGNCFLSFEDFERLLKEDGECCTAVEKENII